MSLLIFMLKSFFFVDFVFFGGLGADGDGLFGREKAEEEKLQRFV